MESEVVLDGLAQIGDAAKAASTDAAGGDLSKESLDLIKPA